MNNQINVPYQLIIGLELAARAHSEQRRESDHSPYLNHLIEVVSLLVKFGHFDEHLLISALLHDVIEDTTVNYEQLDSMFGKEVAETVNGLSDNKRLSIRNRRAEQLRKAKTGDKNHQLIQLAGAISSVAIMPLNWPIGWAKESINHLEKLADVCSDACPEMHKSLLIKIEMAKDSLETNKHEIADKINTYIKQKFVFYCIQNDQFYFSECDENVHVNVSVMHSKFDAYMRSIRVRGLSFYTKSVVFESITSTVSELGIINFDYPIEAPILRGLMQVAML